MDIYFAVNVWKTVKHEEFETKAHKFQEEVNKALGNYLIMSTNIVSEPKLTKDGSLSDEFDNVFYTVQIFKQVEELKQTKPIQDDILERVKDFNVKSFTWTPKIEEQETEEEDYNDDDE